MADRLEISPVRAHPTAKPEDVATIEARLDAAQSAVDAYLEQQPPIGEAHPAHPRRVLELSVVMPCLNEADTLAVCIEKAQRAMTDARIVGEVIVADNGSTDGSIEIAERWAPAWCACRPKDMATR